MTDMQSLSTGQGYLKAGFLGFAGSGKTFTAAMLACALYQHAKLDGPIAMFDTEGGSPYIAPMVKELIGIDLVGVRARAFDDLMIFAEKCEAQKVPIIIVDSVTHPWREICDAYLKTVNDKRAKRNRGRKNSLEFQDWAPIKAKWGRWTAHFLNSQAHIIICGRAGFEYDFTTDADTGKKDLKKTGVKMKTEGEFGFEPSLLVEMVRHQHDDEGWALTYGANVLKDRFNVLNGLHRTFRCEKGADKLKKEFAAVADFFAPHLERLQPGAHAPVDAEVKTHHDIGDSGDPLARERETQKKIILEEIKGYLLQAWPSQSTKDKAAKGVALEKCFGTLSWTAVEQMDLPALNKGLSRVIDMVTAATEEKKS